MYAALTSILQVHIVIVPLATSKRIPRATPHWRGRERREGGGREGRREGGGEEGGRKQVG